MSPLSWTSATHTIACLTAECAHLRCCLFYLLHQKRSCATGANPNEYLSGKHSLLVEAVFFRFWVQVLVAINIDIAVAKATLN